MKTRVSISGIGLITLAAMLSGTVLGVHASSATESDVEMAKKLSNPISSLISLPFQFNYDQGFGPKGDGDQLTLNIQPVFPVKLTDEWLMISRTILPVIWRDDHALTGEMFGTGDILQSLFFSPTTLVSLGPGANLTWGVGPVISIPTATRKAFGSKKLGLGPTGIVLVQKGPWTVGALANHVWSIGKSSRPDVNQTFVQPFLAYTTKTATTFSVNTEASYNWEGKEWSIPINFAVSQLVPIGKQIVSFQIGSGYYAAHTTGGPEGWRARFSVTLLFPK